ncbi:MAG TPA: hypothetical protein GX708_18830 [Gallicola sp.]|nr:hypothetical protein [Gallicola sp.]
MKKYSPNETKGALFAKRIDDETFEIEKVYFEPNVGSFAFVKLYNNRTYKKFCKNYFDKHVGEYHIHNYLGDWHSHPSFSCTPSSYDVKEVEEDLKKSNAKFLVQIILKDQNNKLVGNAFYYNENISAKKIDLIIQ